MEGTYSYLRRYISRVVSRVIGDPAKAPPAAYLNRLLISAALAAPVDNEGVRRVGLSIILPVKGTFSDALVADPRQRAWVVVSIKVVVSMKNTWNRIFALDTRPSTSGSIPAPP